MSTELKTFEKNNKIQTATNIWKNTNLNENSYKKAIKIGKNSKNLNNVSKNSPKVDYSFYIIIALANFQNNSAYNYPNFSVLANNKHIYPSFNNFNSLITNLSLFTLSNFNINLNNTFFDFSIVENISNFVFLIFEKISFFNFSIVENISNFVFLIFNSFYKNSFFDNNKCCNSSFKAYKKFNLSYFHKNSYYNGYFKYKAISNGFCSMYMSKKALATIHLIKVLLLKVFQFLLVLIAIIYESNFHGYLFTNHEYYDGRCLKILKNRK